MLARARLFEARHEGGFNRCDPCLVESPRPEDAFLDRGIANSDEPRLLFDGHMFFLSLE
jgi:hypothetical protein